jgi:ABC-2 type transport system ATP-binding protein
MIEVKDISYKYPGQKGLVFCDFSLTLEQNKIYGLLGMNGTGKSTLPKFKIEVQFSGRGEAKTNT